MLQTGSGKPFSTIISHQSALLLWLANAAWLSRNAQPTSGLDIARSTNPSGNAASAAAAKSLLADLKLWHESPIDVLVADPATRHQVASLRTHAWIELPAFPNGTFFWIRPGLYISSPALATCQVARRLSTVGLISLISCLLGTYTTSELSWTGTIERPVLMTSEQLSAQALWQPRELRCNRIAHALRQSFAGCRSPAEVKLAMTLHLPSMLGGQNVRRGCINHKVPLNETAQAMFNRPYVVYDLGWEETRHVLEYNGRPAHQDPGEDAQRMAALHHMGYTVTPIYQKQLESVQFMSALALELKRELGQTIHPVTPATSRRRLDLATALRGAGEPWTHELLGRDTVIVKNARQC